MIILFALLWFLFLYAYITTETKYWLWINTFWEKRKYNYLLYTYLNSLELEYDKYYQYWLSDIRFLLWEYKINTRGYKYKNRVVYSDWGVVRDDLNIFLFVFNKKFKELNKKEKEQKILKERKIEIEKRIKKEKELRNKIDAIITKWVKPLDKDIKKVVDISKEKVYLAEEFLAKLNLLNKKK